MEIKVSNEADYKNIPQFLYAENGRVFKDQWERDLAENKRRNEIGKHNQELYQQ